MNTSTEQTLAKVPEVTLGFWLIKIAATTLGETGGDAVSMSMNLGYLAATGIFAALFAACVVAQVRAERLRPWLYWATIVATTTVGTTLADFADRSLGIGYAGGSALLLVLLLGSLLAWQRTLGTVSVASVHTRQAETFYWVTIMFSQTLGTALGDWAADGGLGYSGGALAFGAALAVLAGLWLVVGLFCYRRESCHAKACTPACSLPPPCVFRHCRSCLSASCPAVAEKKKNGRMNSPAARLARISGRIAVHCVDWKVIRTINAFL